MRAITILQILGLLSLLALAACGAWACETMTIEYVTAQTAVLDPAKWDTVIPGERYFDALRAMLVRFPGIAEKAMPLLQQGYRIEKAELVLRWEKQEKARPERGRAGWGADEAYNTYPGEWHVQAWALQRPWSVDNPVQGPTFNAWINGAGYWNRGGGRGDGTDRYPRLFGPEELHAKRPEARLDVTALFADATYGKTPADCLRAFEERGFQVHKQEIRDMKYRNFYAYDWAVDIGYMKIWVQQPMLALTLARGGKAVKPGTPAPPVDIAGLAKALVETGKGGTPAVAIPADWQARIDKHLVKPDGVPEWQWQRILELRALGPEPSDSQLYLGRGFNFAPLWAGDQAAYLKAMENLLLMPPRTWQGHATTDFAILPAAYGDLLPPAVLDHLKVYWSAWLHPEVTYNTDENLGGGSHRGGPTYFRGYTRNIGTTNFNHNAISGAMLGAQLIGSDAVRRDAGYGLENLLMRTHVFSDGAHQEIGDTYYQAITVANAGAIAKYAEAPVDRLLGRILRDRLVEPLISMYHPGLRRMTQPMARGDFSYQLLLQEGPYSVLHSLSPNGVLMHLDELATKRRGTPTTWGKVRGVSILGDEAPPQRIAVLSPWIEPYLADSWATMLDSKSLPWSILVNDEYAPGERNDGWQVNYLGKNFALASRDNTNHSYGTIPIAAQWRRKAERVNAVDDYSTLQINFGLNGNYTPPSVSMAEFGVVQQHNKMLALKALPDRSAIEDPKTPITSLHASVALFATGDCSRREVWINGQKINALSGARPDPGDDWKKRMRTNGAVVNAKDGDIITINDGVTYLGLIPITANTLERDTEVELSYEYPVMLIHTFLRKADGALDLDRVYQAEKKATAGYLLEMGDAAEYASFAAFQQHMAEVKLTKQWNDAGKMLEVSCRSGNDVLEMGYDPARYPAVYRRINGNWPYLPKGIYRDTPWSVQGITGRLEKHGAVLENEPGRTGYLLGIPQTGTYVGYNPLPDPTAWRLTLPGGVRLFADARVSVLRAAVRPAEGKLWIDYAVKPGQNYPDMATALLVTGLKQAPQVVLNDKALAQCAAVTINGEQAYVIPLAEKLPADLATRTARFGACAGAGDPAFFRGWMVAGPFPMDFNAAYPPEQRVNLTDTYQGFENAVVKWQPVLKAGEPVIGTEPVNLEQYISPSPRMTAYAYAVIRSDRARKVTMLTGSDQQMVIRLNGKPVFQHRDFYRTFSRDQDRTIISLKRGNNPVLIKFNHGYEKWRFSFRLADLEGMPLGDGVSYVTTP